ncbi:MAG: hypothetical protein NTZ16_04620 [Verrucomicrobia bacterium]|nr:hypothetical protein [Verrucomicrobiota bacterium]
MPNFASNLESVISQRVSSALQQLLETKHLYQSVEIVEKEFDETVNHILGGYKRELFRGEPGSQDSAAILKRRTEKLSQERDRLLCSDWFFYTESNPPPGAPPIGSVELPPIPLPSVRVSCGSKQCKGSIQPHNSGFIGWRYGVLSFDVQQNGSLMQVFSFPYQCQNCKEEPLVFLVKRENLKLTLVGRSQFPEVSVPDFIPKEQRKFYRNAVVVSQANFGLAAAMYLRTLIEQHFYQVIPSSEIEAIKKRGSPRGDELAELYAKTLPKGFPSDFPSLRKAYDDLSEVLHRGKEDDEASKKFVGIKADIDKHFDALRVFNSILAK